jgi:hypothetical protein
MRNRFLLLSGLSTLLAFLILGCSLGGAGVSRITPTPTKTPRSLFTATLTAMPSPLSTDTPLPTDTPVPPTDTPFPTDTPLPTNTPVPPTDTPAPVDTAAPPTDTPPPPTNTPRPAVTNTASPPTNTPKPNVDFRIKEIVAFEDGSLTKTGFHNIYFSVVDAGGAPLDGIILVEVNNQPPVEVVTGDKGPGKTEFTMYAGDYRFKVAGDTNGQTFSSEETHVLSIVFGHAVWDDLIRGGICTDAASCQAMGPMHYSYNVTFQRTH